MPRKPNPVPQTRKSLTLDESMWEEIVEVQTAERIKTEAEAVRRVIQEGLRSIKRKAKS